MSERKSTAEQRYLVWSTPFAVEVTAAVRNVLADLDSAEAEVERLKEVNARYRQGTIDLLTGAMPDGLRESANRAAKVLDEKFTAKVAALEAEVARLQRLNESLAERPIRESELKQLDPDAAVLAAFG